ncbi:MAG: hypothetical protein HZB26_01425 [Candidatus Hydrogenedentes bacterium]|nr:hypothetical protein [Candidatus Hydrogenedentota bacterium]
MEPILAVMMCALAAGAESTGTPLDQVDYHLGPLKPTGDLRSMLTRYLVQRSCDALDATATRRHQARTGGADAWRESVRKAVRDAMGPMPFGATGGPLNVRAVSRVEKPEFIVENVLFESFPGLDVNASIFLPRAEQCPPPWIPIVVPVGHDTKTLPIYQHPAQVFTRFGYVAITFDPPDMSGEKQEGNDHFRDGIRCYLTSQSSNRYFILDALRCIDYLATRADIDLSKGVGITGVSGGGMTSMYAALLDDRIRAVGPACRAVAYAEHPVRDGYGECPEALPFARFAKYDDMDLLAAAAPTPMLLMAGAKDEVFTEAMSRKIAEDVKTDYEAAKLGDRFRFHLDPGGHAYTVGMACEFVKWMDKWVRGIPERSVGPFNDGDFLTLPAEELACHPRQDRNIFSVNRDEALRLRAQRKPASIRDAARLACGLGDRDSDALVPKFEARLSTSPFQAWQHYVQEIILDPEPGIELPGTFIFPKDLSSTRPVLVFFDDAGRWTKFRAQGPLARAIHFIERDVPGFAALTIDLRGWGDTKPADFPYDLASWGGRERWTAYVSAALGDPVMAMRVRDGLCALAHARATSMCDREKIVVGGSGLGGVVALHVAALGGHVRGVFVQNGLASFESLATEKDYAWPADAFMPRVFQSYDLPELAASLSIPVLIANPLDAMKKPMTQDAAEGLYHEAKTKNPQFQIRAGANDTDIVKGIQELLDR